MIGKRETQRVILKYIYKKKTMALTTSVNMGYPLSTLIPIFSSEKYEFQSIKMKTLFKSQELWDIVETGFIDMINQMTKKKNKISKKKNGYES